MNIIKTTVLSLLLVTPELIFGQEPKSTEIEVLGFGKMTTNADFTILIISFFGYDKHKTLLMKKLNDESEIIRKDLMDYGFKPDQITLTDFHIQDSYENANPPAKRRRFQGYRGIIVKFNFEYDLNAKVTDKLATHPLKPTFQFQFQLSEEKKGEIRKILMEKALGDAKTKAEIIASTDKGKLKRIIKIRYGEQKFTPNSDVNTVYLTSAASPSLSQIVNSPSVDYRETIVVTWELE